MVGGIRVVFKRMEFFMLSFRGNKLLQIHFLPLSLLLLLVCSLFFLSLPLSFTFCLNNFLLFLSFLLHMPLHICNFVLNEVEFLMQFLVFLRFLNLCLLVLRKVRVACIFVQLPPLFACYSLFVSLSLYESLLFFFILGVEAYFVIVAFGLSLIICSVFVGLPVFVVIGGIVLAVVCISRVAIQTSFERIIGALWLAIWLIFGLSFFQSQFGVLCHFFHSNYKNKITSPINQKLLG